MMEKLKFKKLIGFTIVELLVVISVSIVLVSIIGGSFLKAQKDSRDQRRVEDLKSLQSGLEQYFLLKGSYPPSSYFSNPTASLMVNNQNVLAKFPTDPKTNVFYDTNSPTLSDTTKYCICATLEGTKNSNAGDSRCDFSNKLNYYCIQNQQ